MTTLEKIRENCNRINEIASELSYIKHREIQELLCEICKYANQEPCVDAVSRKAVLDVINKMGLARTDAGRVLMLEESIKKLPSVQPKPIECEDAISRQAVLDRREILRDEQGTGHQAVKTKYIRELPSVHPKQTGGAE